MHIKYFTLFLTFSILRTVCDMMYLDESSYRLAIMKTSFQDILTWDFMCMFQNSAGEKLLRQPLAESIDATCWTDIEFFKNRSASFLETQ